MTKILKPYTIIPKDLYVQRDADRQIRNIVKDMGRPGYVLVSRQMGKTNLLLNAKRELEGANDVFVYIDLSNAFDDAKSCFENIIDTAIETNLEKFEKASNTINYKRKELAEMPAHKQHTNELRQLLTDIPGKLVIILDEIDALTKTTYSDQIFAQIRSIYFSRVNYKELERLTYILSGVIEPNEIIKDPKISPFNIGQKIFLNDFSKDEFTQLIDNSGLIIPSGICDRIFFWTNGNPRMTWDVCSEVENRLKSGILADNDIDGIVNSLYLTTFDRPPIDHIRELVKENKEIRDSIIKIESTMGKDISDKLKKKLYLSGIINYNETEIHLTDEIHLKNEILRKALNINWVNSIENENKTLIDIALGFHMKEDYDSCLKTFEKYLNEGYEFTISQKSLYYYFMGYSAFMLSKWELGLKYFNLTNFDIEEEDDIKFYYMTLNLKGLIYFYIGNTKSSLEHFKLSLERTKKDEIFARALINFCGISLSSHDSIHIDEAKEMCLGVVNESGLDSSKIDPKILNNLKSISLNHLAQIEISENNTDSAIEYYKRAIPIASNEDRVIITLGLIREIKDGREKENTLQSVVDFILNSNICPKSFNPEYPISFDKEQFGELIFHSFSIENKSIFNKLIKLINEFEGKAIGKSLFDIASYAIQNSLGLKTIIALLNHICQNESNAQYNIDTETIYQSYRLIAHLSVGEDKYDALKRFVALYKVEKKDIDHIDIGNFANYIYILFQRKEYEKALTVIEIISVAKENLNEKYFIDYLSILNPVLHIHHYLLNKQSAKEIAFEILNIIANDNYNKHASNIVNKEYLDLIKKNAEYILNQEQQKKQPIKVERKIGPNKFVNVKYHDGKTLHIKYKKIRDDINAGLCILDDTV